MAGIRIQSVKKRGFLRQIAEAAKRSNLPLKTALINAQQSVASPTFLKGRIVVSTSGSGQAGSFQMPEAGLEWTQDNVFGLLEELIELAESVTATQSLQDDGSNTDAIFAAMIADDSLRSLRQQMGDFSMLNFPASNTR